MGSQVGSVALPLIGLVLLHLPAFELGVLTACSVGAPALLALPAGVIVDRVRRRRLMITCEVVQGVALGSVAVSSMVGRLTFGHLVVVAVVTSAGGLLSSVAAAAHLPALVGPGQLMAANARLESTTWGAALVGPVVGGLLVGAVGAARTLLVDAVSFVLSAVALLAIRPLEAVPSSDPGTGRRRSLRREVGGGLRFVRGHRQLRRLIMSNAVLAWAMVLLAPVELLLIVRDLGASPVQFGLLMSLPCLGGLAGSAIAPRIARRCGVAATLRLSALCRAPTVALPALAPAGAWGLVVVGAAFTGLLFTAGIYNSVQNAYQQQVTPDPLRGRVSAASKWVIGLGKPIAPVLGGALAALLPLRAVFVISALALLLPVLLLDRDRGADRRAGRTAARVPTDVETPRAADPG